MENRVKTYKPAQREYYCSPICYIFICASKIKRKGLEVKRFDRIGNAIVCRMSFDKFFSLISCFILHLAIFFHMVSKNDRIQQDFFYHLA